MIKNLKIQIKSMTKVSITTFLILLLFPFNRSLSQSLTSIQIREINEQLLELINDYESYSRFTADNKRINENYISLFTDLFESKALLYNDILPSNKVSDPVNVSQYIRIFDNYYANGVGIKIHNILFDLPIYIGNYKYEVNAEISKEIYGYTNTNVYYRDTIQLVLTFGFSVSGNNISDTKILGISGDARGRFMKLRVLKFITMKPIENSQIRMDSKRVHTNSQGIARIDGIEPGKKHNLTISTDYYKPLVFQNIDIDEFIEGNTDRNHRKLRLSYYDQNEIIFLTNTLNFTLSPIVSFGIPGLKTIVSEGQSNGLEFENLRERGSVSPRLGIRFGIILLKTKLFDFSLITGIEKNFIRASYSFDTCRIENSPSHPSAVIDLYNFKQKITLNFTDFPVLVSLDYKKIKAFDINANLGIRFSSLNKSNCSIKSSLAIDSFFEGADTLTAKYSDFHSVNRFFTFQAGFSLSKEILPSVEIFAGPTVFFNKSNWFENENVTDGMLTPDEQLNNLLITYTKSSIHYVALEFGIIYNFNTIHLKPIL